MPESFLNPCACIPIPGTTVPPIAPYVVSLNNLYGLVTLAPGGGVAIESQGNSILISTDGTAGLGTVTTVNATSSNTNLVVGGVPITTNGTITFSLAGNLNSISGITMAADQMLYSTGPGTFVATGLTAFGRSLVDDAAAVNARTTLGLIIGTDVQAFSQDLSDFVTNAVWTGANLALAGNLSVVDLSSSGNFTVTGTAIVTGDLFADDGIFGGTVIATSFSGIGSNLTALSATNITTGTLGVTNGGTGFSAYTQGDLIYANTTTTLAKLPDVASGRYLRSGGVNTAPLWSTLTLPNTTVVGDLLLCSSTNVITSLSDVATGNVLISGGVGVAPSWGKVTSSHVNNTIVTMTSGATSDITDFTIAIVFQDVVEIQSSLTLVGQFFDSSSFEGIAGYLLTSTGTGTAWSNQITLDTLSITTALSTSGTITAGGSTGNKTINKLSGTVRIAAAGTSVIVTNNLCQTTSRVIATCSTNDATAVVKNVVTTTGSFTINIAATTGEVEIAWFLINIV